MVALEEVLARDLPVRFQLARRTVVESECLDVHDLGEELRQAAECLGKGRRRHVGIDEDERPPGVDLDREEGQLGRVEVRLAVGPRRGAERAVEAVRPRVVGALQRLALALALRDLEAAVPADVHERLQLVFPCAGHHDGDQPGGRREERARFGELPRVPHVLPGAAEDPLLLETQDLRVRVPVERERGAAGERIAEVWVDANGHGPKSSRRVWWNVARRRADRRHSALVSPIPQLEGSMRRRRRTRQRSRTTDYRPIACRRGIVSRRDLPVARFEVVHDGGSVDVVPPQVVVVDVDRLLLQQPLGDLEIDRSPGSIGSHEERAAVDSDRSRPRSRFSCLWRHLGGLLIPRSLVRVQHGPLARLRLSPESED